MANPVLQTKILSKATHPDAYRLYRAALEWDLIDPIVIEGRDDIKSEPRWKDQIEPYHHQVQNLIRFCGRLPVTLLADDVGLGKTISAGLVVSELMARGHLSRILIVCPKMLGEQWKEELDSKFGISAEIAIGKDLLDAEPKKSGAVITTYQSAREHIEKLPKDRFQMLILDEAHKLRNLYGVESPPQVAIRFRKVLEERSFRYVLMLTATPIQNRLWDIYSLIDLLTVAKGHENPFGSQGFFARKYIADDRESARQLKLEARDEFRSIVYNYMSRVRRGDANLSFPERVVRLERVTPTAEEFKLIEIVERYIEYLNPLSQVSVLFALTSSPQALRAQLLNMKRNGTIPSGFAEEVKAIVDEMKTSAKLMGLEKLIGQLAREKPDWRAVVFTKRLETQTTIQLHLEALGIKVGIINGSSARANQDTIREFRKDDPAFRVIVATEAGSEGLNLQVANVLVNYDLPWNPMIVEQRIGRVQRLASKHKYVSILNITLADTFEEHIVARLLERLQLASHAIGDIEAILEATGIEADDSDNEDEATGNVRGFEEQVRRLVLAALKGQDVREATKRAAESIDRAKEELKREGENINAMLGPAGDSGYVGPKAPKLPPVRHSMEAREFVLAALRGDGFRVSPVSAGIWRADKDQVSELITFDEDAPDSTARLYAPGSSAFGQLVKRIAVSGVHDVDDADRDATLAATRSAQEWVRQFGGFARGVEVAEARRHFDGTAVLRARISVAHDSYERLVEVPCNAAEHVSAASKAAAGPLSQLLETAASYGLNVERLTDAVLLDPAIAEFRRFYLERRDSEVRSAGNDERKRTKLFDEFTPRMELSLVALQGRVFRDVDLGIRYRIETSPEYTSLVRIVPTTGEMLTPPMGDCAETGRRVPAGCLKRCEVSGLLALEHLLLKSDVSRRSAMKSYTLTSEVSGKKILVDEAAFSDLSGRVAALAELKTSDLSGRRGEAAGFRTCDFTGAEILVDELATSEISGRQYRRDQQAVSAVSGMTGHQSEFVRCEISGDVLLPSEADRCELTGKLVRAGLLEPCQLSGRRVLPSELGRCTYSGDRVLNSLLVVSSVSGSPVAESHAIRSGMGRFCLPNEAGQCAWSGRVVHPDDLRVCALTGVPIHVEFSGVGSDPRLGPLEDLLNGVHRPSDAEAMWDEIAGRVSQSLGGARCNVEGAIMAPDERQLAVCCEVRTLLGLKLNHAGIIYSLEDDDLLGHIALGKRASSGWVNGQRQSAS